MMAQWYNLKLSSLKKVALLAFTLIVSPASSQTVTKTIEVPEGITAVYIDRAGEFYIHQSDTILKRFSIQGVLMAQSKINLATVFDPWYGIDLLQYFSPGNNYQFLSNNLKIKSNHTINPAFAIEPYLICLSGEKNIWVLDKADWSIKRINNQLSKVEIESRIPEQATKNASFTFMREYQHFLFLLDRNSGILVFNGIGKLINQIRSPNIEYFNFVGGELYYKKDNEIIFFDLFEGSTRSQVIDPSVQQLFFTDKHILKSYTKKLEILTQ